MGWAKTDAMLYQLTRTHAHAWNHPSTCQANVFHHGDDFFLADFENTKAVTASRNVAGTKRFSAPEVFWWNYEATPKGDVCSLGATIVRCLLELFLRTRRKGRTSSN